MLARFHGLLGILVIALACQAQVDSVPNREPLSVVHSQMGLISPSAENYCRSLLSGPQGTALQNACRFSLSLSQAMPNFVCEMEVEKYEDVSRTYRSTKYMQKIHAQARYVNGKDYYDGLTINGRLAPDNNELIEGTWSFGEFGVKLLAAFNPKNHPVFRYTRKTKVNGADAFEYEFEVEHSNNRFWRWLFNRRSTLPGYEGKLWVAKRDGAILRLHLDSTDGVPDDFPIQSVESKTDYSWVDFKDKSGFILPTKVQIRTSMLDHRVYRTSISYSKCHRFKVDSRVVSESETPQQ